MRQRGWVLATSVAWSVLLAAGGCGDNMRVEGEPPGEGPTGPSAPGGGPTTGDPPGGAPGDDGGPVGACDAKWRDVQLGTELDDRVLGLAVDADDHVYVAGFVHGLTGVTNIEPDGDARGVVTKLDPTGAVVWTTSIDTDGTDTVEDIAIEPETGALYAAGRTTGAFAGFVNQGQFDQVLIALDANGQVTRLQQSGDERPQHPARIGLGVDHDLVVAGYNDTFVHNNAVEGWEDGVVQRLDVGAPGSTTGFMLRFAQSVPITVINRITGVAVERDGSGSIYLTSYVTGGAKVGAYIKKLASDGTQLWSTRISQISIDAATAVGLSPTGALIVAGATFKVLGKQGFGQQDAFVLEVDKLTGAIVWASQAGSAASDAPLALAFDDVGNIYVAGITDGSVAGATSYGGIDVFAMKLAPTGALLATWQAGTDGDDFATSVAVDHCGNVLVGGHSKGAMVVDGHGPAGGDDMFVVRAAL